MSKLARQAHAPGAYLSPFTGHWTDCAAYETNDESDCDCA